MAELVEGWLTQANLPLGLKGASSAINLTQDWMARFIQALLYTTDSKWQFWGDSNGAAVSVGPDPSLTAGDCLTINGVIVPFLSNGDDGIAASELMDAINSMNLPYITASLSTGQVKVDSAGPDFQFGGNPDTLTALGFDTTPADTATSDATWPLALNSFDPEKWPGGIGTAYAWVILRANSFVGEVPGYLLVSFDPASSEPFFDDPYGPGDNSSFINIRLFVGSSPPGNTTSGSWAAPDMSPLLEVPLCSRWTPDTTLTGELESHTDTFDDSEVRTDTDGTITGSGSTHRYVVLKRTPISQTSISSGDVVVQKGSGLIYGTAENVYPTGAPSSWRGRYIYLPGYTSADASITVTYFTWKTDSKALQGTGTPLQVVPRSRYSDSAEFARQVYLFVSVNQNGGFTAWISRTGDGFGPTECASPLVHFTGLTAPPNPAAGLVAGVVNWRKDAAPVSFSKSQRTPGLTQAVNVLRVAGGKTRIGQLSAEPLDNPYDLAVTYISGSQLVVLDFGSDTGAVRAVPAVATSQRATLTRGIESLSADGLDSLAKLVNLSLSAVASMLGVDTSSATIDAGQVVEPTLDPLTGLGTFYDIPVYRLGVPAVLYADRPLGAEYRGTLDAIQWAPAQLTDGSVTPTIAQHGSSGALLLFLGSPSGGGWDLSAATLTIAGPDGVPHTPDVTAVTGPAELLPVLQALGIPGIGFRLIFKGLGLAITTTAQVEVTANTAFTDATGVSSGTYFGGAEQVKFRDCVIPYVTRQAPKL